MGADDEIPENRIGGQIIAAAMTVHSAVGPGLLESAYEACLTRELRKRRMGVRNQVYVPMYYDGIAIENSYRLDLLVEELVIVELKSVETIMPVHRGQVLSYLR
ncbi:MAG TPA: GxxExxY protein, partial [Rhizomicrobium sp.]